jgi:hypothetical protein
MEFIVYDSCHYQQHSRFQWKGNYCSCRRYNDYGNIRERIWFHDADNHFTDSNCAVLL